MTTHFLEPETVTRDWQWRDYSIRTVECGRGRPLIFVHGFGAATGHWRQNLPAIAAAGYRCLALDLLGFGGSDKPARDDYAIELWEDQLADFWRECVGEPAVWVGNSIGGLLCQVMCARHPEMAAGGVLVNCAGGLNHRPEELNPVLGFVLGSFAKLAAAPVLGPLAFSFVSRPSQIRRTLRQVYGNPDAVTDELVDLIVGPARSPGAQQVFATVLNAPPGPKPSELLPQIRCPLLVLWGDRDPWTPIAGAKIYTDLAAARDDVTFAAITGAGHCAHDDNPAAFNRLLCDWLVELPEASRS